MTIKELADLLEVSKPTITKALKELGIEPQKVTNRFIIADKDLEKIIKYIRPQDFESLLEKSKIAENDSGKTENIGNIENENNANSEKSTANSENESDKTAKNENTEQRLIDMLERELERKQDTINEQMNLIKTLTTANTALTARIAMLESTEPQEPIIINEQDTVEPQEQSNNKKHWWQKLAEWFS